MVIISDTIQLDFGVLFILEFIISDAVGAHSNLVRHKQGEDVGPVCAMRLRRDDPDLRRKAVLARDEPSSSDISYVIHICFDVDRLGLRVRYGGDMLCALALVR